MKRLRIPILLALAASMAGCALNPPTSAEAMSVGELVKRQEELLGKHVRVVGYLTVLTHLTWFIADGHPTPDRNGDITCGGMEAPFQYIDVEDENLYTTLPKPVVHVKRAGGTLAITMFPQAIVSGTLEYDASFGSVRLKHPVFEGVGREFCRTGADDF